MRGGGGGHHRLMSAAAEHTIFNYITETRKCIQLTQFINIYLYLYLNPYSYISLFNYIDFYLPLPHLGDLPYSTAMSNAHRERFFNV